MLTELSEIKKLKNEFEHELFESVIPFWERHSVDKINGGYYNCLDEDGSVYDTTKHIWLQARQVWMFSKLYNNVEQKKEWLEIAENGMKFLREKAIDENGRVCFSMTENGMPIYVQRKIFSECFYVIALSEYAKAVGSDKLLNEAKAEFEIVWNLSKDSQNVGRPKYEGETPFKTLAVPMILLNVIEEVFSKSFESVQEIVDECVSDVKGHLVEKTVYENILPNGNVHNSSAGRLLNPGHAIEAGWFMNHWAKTLKDDEMLNTSANIVRWSFEKGWDKEFDGIFYFLDAGGFSPTQLEWDMKLWWPHCEAMYAFLLNYKNEKKEEDWQNFIKVKNYSFEKFSDNKNGEWYGYLNRRGEVTHRFKGGPYKGCFHVPRALYLCYKTLGELEGDIK